MYGVGQSSGSAAYDRYHLTAEPAEMDAHWQDVEAAERLFIGGHVMVGLSAAALGVSLYSFLTRSDDDPAGHASARAVGFGVGATGDGASLNLSGAF